MARRRKMLSIALVVAGMCFAPGVFAAEPPMTTARAPRATSEGYPRTATLDAPQDVATGPVARSGSAAPSSAPQPAPYAHGGQPAARAPAVMSWRGGRAQSRLSRSPLRRRGPYRVAQAPLPGPGAPEPINPGYESAPPPGSGVVEENFPDAGDGTIVESGEDGPSLGYGGYRGQGDGTPDFDPNQYQSQSQPYMENSYRGEYGGDGYGGDAYGYDPSSMEMGYGAQSSDYAGGWQYGDGMGGCCPECQDWSCRDVLCENFSLFAGAQAFKGSTDQFADGIFDRTTGGNFGFHEGANFAIPLISACSIGLQAGGQVVHSNLSGTIGSEATRTQFFGTGGFFHRPQDGTGLQGGAVFDYLHDDFLVDMDLVQVRSELSIVGPNGNDVGFWGAFGVRDDDGVIPVTLIGVVPSAVLFEWKVIDQYAFFFRHEFYNGGNARVWAGFTGTGDGLLGFDGTAPLSQRLSLQAGFNYLIPQEGNAPGAAITETWGLGINLVFTPGHRRACSPFNPYRPLFPVADNSTFFVQQRNVATPFPF